MVAARILVGFAALVLLTSCLSLPDLLTSPSPEVGAKAPEFQLMDLAGSSVDLRDLQGQVVLLNFWATWCGPCREEMPAIQERYNHGDFALFAINFDEDQEKIQGFMNALGINLPVLLDPGGNVQELYRIRGYPTSFFLDTDGIVRFIHIGEMKAADLDYYLDQLIQRP